MRWTLLAALVFGGLRRNPELLNAASKTAAEETETVVTEKETVDPVLADDEEPDATVTHLKKGPPESPLERATQPAAAPSLEEELEGVEGDVEKVVDDVVEQMLAPGVVEEALTERVEKVEKLEEKGAERNTAALQVGLLSAITYLLGVSLSLVFYWILMFAEFLIAGFVWAFLCMGKKRGGKTPSKESFDGDFQPVGLCAWMNSHMTVILEAICCPHFLWADTVAKLGVIEFPAALFLVFMLVCVIPMPYALGFVLLGLPVRAAARTYIRRSYKQASSSRCFDCCQDVLVHSLCCCCAIHQEAVFVEQYQEAFPGVKV